MFSNVSKDRKKGRIEGELRERRENIMTIFKILNQKPIQIAKNT
jgi:hypothetical protein